jgi:general secretion pathway protein I
MHKKNGFTLIEVLLALVIIAIAYLALLSALSSNVFNTQKIEEKNDMQWVALNALNLIKLNLIKIHNTGEVIHEKTNFLHHTYYWKAKVIQTGIPLVEKIFIEVSPTPSGPFQTTLLGFRFQNE